MRQYLDTLEEIMKNGDDRETRNAMTRAIFAKQIRFNLKDGFPAVTTKQLAFKAVKSELLWFLEGSNDDNRLKELVGKDKTIWTANAQADYWKPKAEFDGHLGRIYGVQWRSWIGPSGEPIDQIAELIHKLRTNPFDRRLIVTAWNPGELTQMALPPCHMFFQFFVTSDRKLSVHMTQRSCDMFLGVPFNIASYALLLSMIAQVVDMTPHECVLTLNDAHIYHEHFDVAEKQLKRTPKKLPKLWLNPDIKEIDDFTMSDIKLEDYEHDPSLKAKMIV